MATHYGEATCFSGQSQSRPNGAEPQHSPISGDLLYLRLHSLKKNDQSGLVTHVCWDGLVITQSVAPSVSWLRGLTDPSFAVSPLYLCVHGWTSNNQIRRAKALAGGVVRSATPVNFHKCVARFVSDSGVSCFMHQ